MKRLNRVLPSVWIGAAVALAASAVFAAAALASGLASVATAAEPVDETGVEIVRDAVELRDRLTHPDVDRVDTALVFTNAGSTRQRVVCIGYDQRGRRLGTIWLRVPARGLRYARASDLSHGVDFVGSAECKAGGHVIGSSLLIGPDLTDLPAKTRVLDAGSRLRFPLVVSY